MTNYSMDSHNNLPQPPVNPLLASIPHIKRFRDDSEDVGIHCLWDDGCCVRLLLIVTGCKEVGY